MNVFRQREKGFTLIEAAVIMLLLSIALIPVIQYMSAKGNTSDKLGLVTATSGGRKLTQEQAVANAIMERAISGDKGLIHPVLSSGGDVLSFDKDGNFVTLDADGNPSGVYNLATDRPGGIGTPISNTANRNILYPKYEYGNSGIYYQWYVSDATMQLYDADGSAGTAFSAEYTSFLPKGNNLVKAVLRIYNGETASTKSEADYAVSTYFFKNTSQALASNDEYSDKIGIVLAMDNSLSMKLANYHGVNAEFDFFMPINFGAGSVMFRNTPGWDTNPHYLPMRLSTGLEGYDPSAIASPYLVYRQDGSGNSIEDLYFAKNADNKITPYDERYNPCAVAQNGIGSQYDLPMTYVGASPDYAIPAADFATCHGGVRPAGFSDLFVYIPQMPTATTEANFGAPYNATTIFGDNCTNRTDLTNSTCGLYKTDGTMPINPAVVLDSQLSEEAAALLMGNPGSEPAIKAYLSRVEAARTAMLSFLLTIENDPSLVNNFVIGFVPFSTLVQDGTYTPTGALAPADNEVVALSPPVSGQFGTLKASFLRINRACDFGGSQYVNAPTCPGGLKPITLTGETNLAHPLYYAEKLFSDYETNYAPLSQKIIVLLTDGKPNNSATAWNAPAAFAGMADEQAKLLGISDAFATNDINIHTVGLLTGGEADAVNTLNAIKGTNPDNALVFVENVGDLTPIFEAIAQQAESFVLEQMKQRYSYLDY